MKYNINAFLSVSENDVIKTKYITFKLNIYADTNSAYDLLTMYSIHVQHTLADCREHFSPKSNIKWKITVSSEIQFLF